MSADPGAGRSGRCSPGAGRRGRHAGRRRRALLADAGGNAARPGRAGRGGRHDRRGRHLLRRTRGRPGRGADLATRPATVRSDARNVALAVERSRGCRCRRCRPGGCVDARLAGGCRDDPLRTATDRPARRRCRSAPTPICRSLDDAKILGAPEDPADRPRWRGHAAPVAGRGPRADGVRRLPRTTRPEVARGPRRPTPWRHGLALGRAAVRDWDGGAVHARTGCWPRYERVRRPRRGGAVARVPGHRDRRPQPVRLLPRRARASRSWWPTCTSRGVQVFVDYNPWDIGTRRAERTDAARARRAGGGPSASTASSSTP